MCRQYDSSEPRVAAQSAPARAPYLPQRHAEMEHRVMCKTVRLSPLVIGILSLVTVALTAALPRVADAQETCNTFLAIEINPAGPLTPGGTKTVTLFIGAGEIQRGTKVTVSHVRYDLDCNGDLALGLPCTDQGDIFRYQGDTTIGSTCPGVTWTSNVAAGGNATNEIVFTPSAPINISAGTYPYCALSFDIKLDNVEPTSGPSSDSTPLEAEAVAGFVGNDAVCDNGLPSESSQSAQACAPCLP
jgi:hypothetical protein